jgi:hypothetical protein
MTKLKLTSAMLNIGAAIFLITPVQGGEIILNTPSYDSPNGYDFVTTTPPTGSTTIGTYTFTPFTAVELDSITGITISGTFGNGDVPTTALSDYFLGFAGDETAVEVAACDSISDNCYSGQEGPYAWNATLTSTEISDLAPALEAGSIDFTYTWGSSPPIPDPFFSSTGYDDQYVYAGATQLDITSTPEPNTVLFCLGGMAGVIMLRRFRKV